MNYKKIIPMILITISATAVNAADRSLNEQSIAAFILSASNEIIIVAPALRIEIVAQALLDAVAKNGVKVKMMTSTEYVLEPASYWWHIKEFGGQLRTINKVNAYDLFIDGKHLIRGPKMSIRSNPLTSNETVLITNTNTLKQSYSLVQQTWAKATPFSSDALIKRYREAYKGVRK